MCFYYLKISCESGILHDLVEFNSQELQELNFFLRFFRERPCLKCHPELSRHCSFGNKYSLNMSGAIHSALAWHDIVFACDYKL